MYVLYVFACVYLLTNGPLHSNSIVILLDSKGVWVIIAYIIIIIMLITKLMGQRPTINNGGQLIMHLMCSIKASRFGGVRI